MKIYWIHTFNPQIKSAGVFMFDSIKELNLQKDIIIPVYVPRNISLIKVWIKLIFLSIREKDSLFHAQYGSYCGLLVSLLPTKRKLITLRGSDYYESNFKELRNSRSLVVNRITNLSLLLVDKILVVSKRLQTDLNDKHSLPSTVVNFKPYMKRFSGVIKTECRRRLGLEDSSFVVLFSSVQNDNPIKRFGLAKESLSIAGQMNKEIVPLNMVDVQPGDTKYYLGACDLVLLTSFYEGWPNIIKEGLLLGKPFVATDVSDLKDIALDEINCVVLDVDSSSEDLANAIFELSIKSSCVLHSSYHTYFDGSAVLTEIYNEY
jgi:teichuronic acid biosynthesis glycosyltransferase TuaC